jgi:hypothetical protein
LFRIALASPCFWNYFGIIWELLLIFEYFTIEVSGPAAGLTAIILTAISDLGAFNILY